MNKQKINFKDKDGKFSLSSSNLIEEASFYFNEAYDEKTLDKFIKACEQNIRQSREYRYYIEQLKRRYDELKKDAIFNNINSDQVTMEMHHYPLNLYEIVQIVVLDSYINSLDFTTFSIAKKVMDEHFIHNIGLVPVSTTTHKLAHQLITKSKDTSYDRMITFSKKQVFGRWENFVEKYKKGISLELQYKIDQFNKLNENEQIRIDSTGIFE